MASAFKTRRQPYKSALLARVFVCLVSLLGVLQFGQRVAAQQPALAGQRTQPPPRCAESAVPSLSWVGRLLLGSQFAQMMDVYETSRDFEAALWIELARANAANGSERVLEEWADQAIRRSPSLKKSCEAIREAVAKCERSVWNRYAGASLKIRMVTVALTLQTIEVRPTEPIAIGAWQVLRRSDFASLLAELKMPAPPAVQAALAKPSRAVTTCVDEMERDQPLLVLWRVRWVPLVEGKSAPVGTPEQLAREAIRRAPPTATVYLVYEIIPQKKPGGAVGEDLPLETAKLQFTWTPDGWCAKPASSRCIPNRGPN